ncbi:hypothetical protein BKI52_21710 [marine bacterium AO1-C]|nr:hypothetical protein BKI52_21710 [marine bacterium AO1-C]
MSLAPIICTVAQTTPKITALIKQVNQTSDPSKKVGLLLELSTLEIWAKTFGSAITHAKQAQVISQQNKKIQSEVWSLLLLGKAHQSNNEYSKALEYLLQADITANKSGNERLKMKSKKALGSLYSAWKIYDKSLKNYHQSYQMTTADDHQSKAVIAKSIASIYNILDDKIKGIKWYEKALNSYKVTKNDQGIDQCLKALANLYQQTGRVQEALKYDLEIVERKKKSQENAELIDAYSNIGILYKQQKEYNKALGYYKKALNLSKKGTANNPRQVSLFTNIAIIQVLLKKYREAEASYFKALKYAKLTKDDLLIAEVYNHLAAHKYIYGKTILATEYAQKSIDLAQPYESQPKFQNKAQNTLSTSYKLLASIHWKEENFQVSQGYNRLYNAIETAKKRAIMQRKQQLLQDEIKISQKENEVKLLLKEKEKQALLLKQAQMKAAQRESDLRLRTKELELVKRDQELQVEKLKSQELEQARIKQLLQFTKQQALAFQQEQKIKLLKKDKALQELSLAKQSAEKKQKQKEIALLKKEQELKDTELKDAKRVRMLGGWILSLGGIALLAVVIALVMASRSKRQLRNKNQVIQVKQEEIATQNEELLQQQEELEAQRDFTDKQNKELDHQNQQMKKSMTYASNIQHALLPSYDLLTEHFEEHFIIFHPKDIVSGDFYWFAQITSSEEDQKLVAVVDCTGHGVPGALMSMIGNSVLHETVVERKIYAPNEILERLHCKVREDLQQQDDKNTDGMDVCLCKLKPLESGQVEVIFSGAKRNLYYTHQGKLEKLKGDRVAIGGFQHEVERKFTQEAVILDQGDVIYLSSDGFVDTPNPSRKPFGNRRFEEVLQTNIDQDLNTQKEALEQARLKFQKYADQRDDILVVGIRV